MGVEVLEMIAEEGRRVRRRWKLGAAARVSRNAIIIKKRVAPDFAGLEGEELVAARARINEQMEEAGVNVADFYSRLKRRDAEAAKKLVGQGN